MGARIYILQGVDSDGGVVKFALSSSRHIVGRQGDIKLLDGSVSRQHASLSMMGADWVLTDLGSRNGTYVNHVAVQRQFVRPGDVIRFGGVTLRFAVVDSSVSHEAPTFVLSAPCRASDVETVKRQTVAFQALVGRSAALQGALQRAALAAQSKAAVLIVGETGTGKELIARYVYAESCRRRQRFLAVNCGAIEPTLQGSTLFGHEKGAFTGADRMRKGVFEEASGGTLFLDEIGELTPEMQVKLLRVLQEGEIMRLGSNETVKVDVRLICATNRDLKALIARGLFRQDLYYRLNVIRISLPPLRERKEDIPDLVRHFASRCGGGATKEFSPEALEILAGYDWPGNVRELANAVECAASLCEGREVGPECLPEEVRLGAAASGEPNSTRTGGAGSLAAMERQMIEETLAQCNGNVSQAAARMGISRSGFYGKLKKFGINA